MREIEQQMCRAIRAGKAQWVSGNTRVRRDETGVYVYLHGNLIAHGDSTRGWKFRLAGWNTPTTRSRINALASEFRPGAGVHCEQFIPYSNGRAVDTWEWF